MHDLLLPRLAAAGLTLGLTAPLLAQDEPEPEDYVSWSDLLGSDSTLQFYGFVRFDTQWNDSRFNDPQIPGYVRSEDSSPPGGVPAGVVAPEDDSELALHARLTRFGAQLHGPRVDHLGADLSGRVEIDFYNIGLGDSDSRSAVRMRRAYLELDWEQWSLLAGQEWDLISPLYPAVNSDLVMWGAGNTGDRRPQLRAEHKADLSGDTLTTTFGIGLAGAVSSSGVVGGLRSGENSGRPMLAARVGYETAGGTGFGVWGHESQDKLDNDGDGDEERFDSTSVGVDFHLPFDSETWLKGEYWTGENVDDIRGGIFQGINSSGGEIGADGGFVEVGRKLTEHATLSLGYSFDDPDDDDLDAFMRAENNIAYATVVWKYGPLKYGLEYLNWNTEYVGLDDGEANRFVGWISFSF